MTRLSDRCFVEGASVAKVEPAQQQKEKAATAQDEEPSTLSSLSIHHLCLPENYLLKFHSSFAFSI